MGKCSNEGGCPSDYLAIVIASLSMLLLLSRLVILSCFHKVPRNKDSSFWIPIIQVFASFNFLLSNVAKTYCLLVRLFRGGLVISGEYFSAPVWVEGPFGFGLMLSCRITQAFQLYSIFVRQIVLTFICCAHYRQHLPAIKSYIFLPLVLFPWLCGAASTLVGFTAAIRHIEFRFDELKELWRGILVSGSAIGIWVTAYALNETRYDISWLQVASRFFLLLTESILVLVFFSISSSQPLLSQISLRRREPLEYGTMGQALGIPNSGLLFQCQPLPLINPNEPLDKLLLNKRFRQSFMGFADSCLAGESVHFYDEVNELQKIPLADPVKRIYMARHIIQKYVNAGATMEINISHRTRQEILTTSNLADFNLFNNAVNELLHLMKTNLAKDYWSSIFFIKFKEEFDMLSNELEPEQMTSFEFSPRLSSVHGHDDPFHQEHNPKGSYD
ncbi:hypothetical protein ACFE04_024534 [Oxalis oulophora]